MANVGFSQLVLARELTLQNAKEQIVAFETYLLSVKDHNQSANLHALIAAGVRGFKVEGRH